LEGEISPFKSCAPWIVSVLLLIPSLRVLAQGELVELEMAVEYDYGDKLRFSATIPAPQAVARAAVFFRTQGSTRTQYLIAKVSPGDPASAIAEHDLRISPFSPFSSVEYWWQVDWEDGTSSTSEHSSFIYDDNRFEWELLPDPPLLVHWIHGDIGFGQSALDVANNALQQIQRDWSFPPPRKLDIYIYDSTEAFQSALSLSGRTWAGGHADPTIGVVLLAVSPGPEGFVDIERLLPHELTHVMLYQRMGENYANLPEWFDEGMATLQEMAPSAELRIELENVTQRGRLFTMETLCAAFPFATSDAILAYAESASFVQYIKDVYGAGAINALIIAYQEGVTCTGGVQRVLQRTLRQVEVEWREAVLGQTQAETTLGPLLPWILLSAPVALVVIAGLLPLGRRRSKRR